MKPKVLKTDAEYQAARNYLESLSDAQPNTPEAEEYELFSLLIQQYEEHHFPRDFSDPVEAIQYRMRQLGLTRKDMQHLLGSRSAVYQVLNRKRPLSLNMIRTLHTWLGIPAEVLLRQSENLSPDRSYQHIHYPFTEMFRRGYFQSFRGTLRQAKSISSELLEQFFRRMQDHPTQMVFCNNLEGAINPYALEAWQTRVLDIAEERKLPPYCPIDRDFLHSVVRLSREEAGPKLSQEALAERGVPLVILPHLPATYLDGACFKLPSGQPVVGLTLRVDSQENFWFTLVHELAHVILHLDQDDLAFFDDTEQGVSDACSPFEKDASSLAADILVPDTVWEQYPNLPVSHDGSEVVDLADRVGVSPAVVAARVRSAANDYTILERLLGRNSVRQHFATSG